MELLHAAGFLSEHRQGVLITLKGDGSPQSSNIVYHHRDGVARISVTSSTAKARNLARDPRASLHVTSSDFRRDGPRDPKRTSPKSAEPTGQTNRPLDPTHSVSDLLKLRDQLRRRSYRLLHDTIAMI